MTTTISFGRRILFLSCSKDAIRAQLENQDLTLAEALPLRDNISTDEITPVTVMMTYDQRLGRFPYVGFKTEDVLPIGEPCTHLTNTRKPLKSDSRVYLKIYQSQQWNLLSSGWQR